MEETTTRKNKSSSMITEKDTDQKLSTWNLRASAAQPKVGEVSGVGMGMLLNTQSSCGWSHGSLFIHPTPSAA